VSVRSSIAVLAVLALVGLLVYGLVQKGSSRVAVGEQAPSTSLPRLEGGGDGQAFVEQYGLSYPQLRDGDGGAAHGFGTTGVPENFLVDPKGIVRWETPGPVDEQYLHEQVEPFLPQEKS
jgi:hypothetical protein